jgi:hypothetical protein
MPHLSLADVLFIGAVAAIPKHRRPWGAITWVAETFAISRVSVYALRERIRQRMQDRPPAAALPVSTAEPEVESAVMVTAHRLARTILAATFPGNVSIRPTQVILEEAFDQRPSIGWISQLRLEAGRQAGELLSQVDTSPLGPLIVVRDETFFQARPILLVIDPVSMTILLAQVCPDRQADTWGLALLMAQDGGATIGGLVEDGARFYAKSQRLVDMGHVEVQKDPWHLLRDGGKVRLYLEKQAYGAMRAVMKLEQQLMAAWDEALFQEHYLPAAAQEERLIAQHDACAEWLSHLGDAFEIVDWRCGEIRDPASAAWLLDETIAGLAHIDQARVQSFVKTLRNHRHQLLTFLDWTTAALTSYRTLLAQQIVDPQDRQLLERLVARHWSLQQRLINGHRQWQTEATQAKTDLLAAIADDPARQHLATQLMRILDGAGHTSSLVECVNSLLKPFLRNRQSFRNPETMQAYLNLFVLWHNMRVFQRGKRQGQSPYQLAGIDLATDDWLELLGFPAS